MPKSLSLFSWKNKKKNAINFSSAKSVQSVVKVKMIIVCPDKRTRRINIAIENHYLRNRTAVAENC